MANKPHIIVLGSLNIDYVIHTPKMPKPGETLSGQAFRQGLGGKGANQAFAASRLGARVSMAGKLGNDLQGKQWIEALAAEGISAEHIGFSSSESTGTAWILIEPSGENRIIIIAGANYDFSEQEIIDLKQPLSSADMLILQLEMGHMVALNAAKLAHSLNIPVLFNPAPVSAGVPEYAELLKHTTILTPNETEAELLTGIAIDSIEAAEKAALRLLDLGVKKVAITLGSDGVLLADEEGTRKIPAYSVKAVDTVAAGDTFNGALAVKLCQGKSFDEAAAFACAAAALAVTRHGAIDSIPQLAEVERFIEEAN